jgi:hypothetical protein
LAFEEDDEKLNARQAVNDIIFHHFMLQASMKVIPIDGAVENVSINA